MYRVADESRHVIVYRDPKASPSLNKQYVEINVPDPELNEDGTTVGQEWHFRGLSYGTLGELVAAQRKGCQIRPGAGPVVPIRRGDLAQVQYALLCCVVLCFVCEVK